VAVLECEFIKLSVLLVLRPAQSVVLAFVEPQEILFPKITNWTAVVFIAEPSGTSIPIFLLSQQKPMVKRYIEGRK
jgi:hypothetical protein